MKLKLLWMSIKNFKGIRDQKIEFSDETKIYAANGVGKTTIQDAFGWLFFGKDSGDRKVFGIKPVDENGNPINNLENEVEAGIDVDGREVVVKRVQREKWVKPRGESSPQMEGHDVNYFWDNVPIKAGEFKSRIDSIMPERLFKLITNPLYFNSLPWQERREALMTLVGEVPNSEVIDSIRADHRKEDVNALVELLNSGKSLKDWKAQIALQKKKLQAELDVIPSRIDEVSLSIPQTSPNFSAVKVEIEALKKQILEIDTSIEDQSKAFQIASKAIQERQKEIHRLQMLRNERENAIRQQERQKEMDSSAGVETLRKSIDLKQFNLGQKRKDLERLHDSKQRLEAERDKLRRLWEEVNGSVFTPVSDEDCKCPTCQQLLPADRIETIKGTAERNFNESKAKRLNGIVQEANKISSDIVSYDEKIKSAEAEIEDYKNKLQVSVNELKAAEENVKNTGPKRPIDEIITADPEWLALSTDISQLQSMVQDHPQIDLSELKAQRQSLLVKVEELNKVLHQEAEIARAKSRIEELGKQQREYAEQKAHLERQEFIVDKFDRAKMDMIETKVNERFRNVKFRLFKEQINGGEQPCCETLINTNGSLAAWEDANTAGRVQGGLDIINTFSSYHNRYAPIFIDGRESVTEIPPVESQVISLIVSPEDRRLRIAN